MRQKQRKVHARVAGVLLAAACLLVACGGGDSGVPVAVANAVDAAIVLAPTLTKDVGIQSVAVGTDASFAVTVTGTALTYRWQNSVDAGATWSDIAGAIESTLRLSAVAFTDTNKLIRVIVSNSAGSVTSTASRLTVTPGAGAPTVLTQPQPASLTAAAVATFSVTATGTPAPTYTWQRSNDAGLTFTAVGSGASYSTVATTVSDNGALFRVVIANAAGSVTSDAVRLSVTAAIAAPVVVGQPQSVTVTAPGTASFSIAATGTSPAFQWQISRDAGATFSAIAGAAAASYTTPATTSADSGERFRAMVSNSAGTVYSNVATLTVAAAPAASTLQGRTWVAGQLLEADDLSVKQMESDIDDAGHLMVVFRKNNGAREVLYAARGTPGAAGVAPSFTPPVVIDTLAGVPLTVDTVLVSVPYRMVSAPNGNSLVVWLTNSDCDSASYYTTGTCSYLYGARYLASSGAWEAPVKIADTLSSNYSDLQINNAGDIALRYSSWQRQSGPVGLVNVPAVVWRAASQSTFRKQLFPTASISSFTLALDGTGNMLIAGEANQNSTTDIVAYRGTVAAGFGDREVLDTRGAPATFDQLAVGVNGQLLVLWSQSNGSTYTTYAATSATPAGKFNVTDLGLSTSGTSHFAVVTDAGDAILTLLEKGTLRWSANGWSALQTLPAGIPAPGYLTGVAVARNGNLLMIDASGLWLSYDAGRNSLIQRFTTAASGTGYVFGLNQYGIIGGGMAPRLSVSGIGAMTFLNNYDVLPTTAAPMGDSRNVVNLWGVYLK